MLTLSNYTKLTILYISNDRDYANEYNIYHAKHIAMND